MRILRDPLDVSTLPSGLVRSLLTERIAELSQDEPYDPAINGFFIVAEASDDVAALEQASGCRLLSNRFSSLRLGDAGFTPDWECLEFHSGQDGGPGCFSITFVLSDDGYGVVMLIPLQDDMDLVLLSLCRTYASSAA